jgi:hypothetical protein
LQNLEHGQKSNVLFPPCGGSFEKGSILLSARLDPTRSYADETELAAMTGNQLGNFSAGFSPPKGHTGPHYAADQRPYLALDYPSLTRRSLSAQAIARVFKRYIVRKSLPSSHSLTNSRVALVIVAERTNANAISKGEHALPSSPRSEAASAHAFAAI